MHTLALHEYLGVEATVVLLPYVRTVMRLCLPPTVHLMYNKSYPHTLLSTSRNPKFESFHSHSWEHGGWKGFATVHVDTVFGAMMNPYP